MTANKTTMNLASKNAYPLRHLSTQRRAVVVTLLSCVMAALCHRPCVADSVDYEKDIAPILETYCVGCHADDPEGGLNLTTYDQVMAGGTSGLAVTAGAASSSRLWMMLAGKLEPAMPPEGEPRPTETERELLERWIEAGALGPTGTPTLKRELRLPEVPANEHVNLPVTAIAMSTDGRRRAVARYGQVEVLDDQDQVISRLTGPLEKVSALQFNRDATRLLVASGIPGAYGNAVLFDVSSGKVISEWVGHRDMLYAAVFSPDEQLAATCGYDREIVIWDVASGQEVRRLKGHNGAIFDLAFSPDGRVLCSASADETVKVWSVSSGQRLDTLGQPGGEVFAVDVTRDGRHVVAVSSDNRLRVWRLESMEAPAINPLIATRFVDESPLVNVALSQDGNSLVAMGRSGSLKVIRTSDWTQQAVLDPLEDMGSDLVFAGGDRGLLVATMSGRVVERTIPEPDGKTNAIAKSHKPIYLDLGEAKRFQESELAKSNSQIHALPRNATVRGTIAAPSEADAYTWQARRGEVWAIDADAVAVDGDDAKRLDPVVAILNAEGRPVRRVRLQAIRDTYFTFRGKDSNQSGDFRLFNWQELKLDEYLYSAGEVTKLWMHPRGPDSGFNVYPGSGKRWTYFGTTQTTHALGEPAYIVRPLAENAPELANGLPVFEVFYENDDDPLRNAGTNSRLLFTAPHSGTFTVRVSDTRGEGGPTGYGYELRVRPADPRFKASVGKAKSELKRGTGREFTVRIQRFDGFAGPVTFDSLEPVQGITANLPLTIESGQNSAVGTVWVDEEADWKGKKSISLVAYADIHGRRLEQSVGSIGEFELADRPSVIPSIHPADHDAAIGEAWVLEVRRGSTTTARVRVDRKEGFTGEVRFGNETSGRNASQGVYVDNIGLNGLLIIPNTDEREFFLTADPTATPGERSFFLTAQVDGNVTTHPIVVRVLP